MRIFIAIDVETDGLDPTTNKITEYGWSAHDIDLKRLVMIGGRFVNRVNDTDTPDGRHNFSDEIHDLTRIERGWVQTYGVSEERMRRDLDEITLQPGVEAVVAHNHVFDASFLKQAGWTTELQWVDTLVDLPRNEGNKALRYVALDRQVLSFAPHRAGFDAMMTGAILCTYDFYEVRERSKSPMVILAADVTFKENQKAKNLDFRWERPLRHSDLRIPKTWCKGLKEMDLRDEQVRCGKAGVMTHLVSPLVATNGESK